MSSEIGLNDVKPGMWVEFDDDYGHYAGELHEVKKPENPVDVFVMLLGNKPPLYIETEDEGNLVVFLDFGDGYTTGSARNVHVYESKPEPEDESEPVEGMRVTDITKVRPGDKVVVKNGNEYTVKKTDSDRIGGQTLCLSIEELGFPDGWWMDDSFFQYAYRGPYTMADLPEEPGFYKARTESVWKHDGKRWMPVLSHDGTIAPAFPCQSQSRSQFFKTSVRDGRFPFTKVEASFE